MTVEDLTISGFVKGVRIVPDVNTAGTNPVSVVLRNNRIEVTSGTNSTIGVEVIRDEIPFWIENNIIVGPGIEQGDSDHGIFIARSNGLGASPVEQTHGSLIKDNEIAAIRNGITVRDVLLPNLQIIGGVIGEVPSDPTWSGDSVNSGVRVTGDADPTAPAVQRVVGTVATDVRLASSNAVFISRANDVRVIDSSLHSTGTDALVLFLANDVHVAGNLLRSDVGTALETRELTVERSLRNTWSGNTYVTTNTIPVESAKSPNGQVDVNDAFDTDDAGPNAQQNHVDPVASTPTYLGDGWEVPIGFDASQTGRYTIEFYAATPLASGETLYRPVTSITRTRTAGTRFSESGAPETLFFPEGAGGWQAGEELHSVVTAPDGSSSELAPITGVLSNGTTADAFYYVTTVEDDFDTDYSFGDLRTRPE